MRKLSWRRSASSNRGVALFIALVAVVLVSFIAVLVMRMTTDRYHSAKMDMDQAGAAMAAEAGTQYAWTRLRINDANPLHRTNGTNWPPVAGEFHGDPTLTFRDRVDKAPLNSAGNHELIISSVANLDPARGWRGGAPDHFESSLRIGDVRAGNFKDVVIRITTPDPPNARYQVDSRAEYRGTTLAATP